MSISLDTLTRWRMSLRGLLTSIRQAQVARNPQTMLDRLKSAESTAVLLVNQLEQAGAEKKEGPPRGSDVPLGLLDTPANRRYLAALRVAWEAGLEVDRERYGPNIGTDGCAQVIEMVIWDVEAECFGVVGKE